MKNVSLAPAVTPFARGLAMSELTSELMPRLGTMRDGGSGVNAAAAWRPATPTRATYAAAAAIAALPTVKATPPTATKQHQVTTDTGRDTARTNSTIEGSPPWRIPV
jgi:hypothetical protein